MHGMLNHSNFFISLQRTWMHVNFKTHHWLGIQCTLWTLLYSLTWKLFISVQLGGSIWYGLAWIGNVGGINKIIYPNLPWLEGVLFKPCWYGICFFFVSMSGSQLLCHSFLIFSGLHMWLDQIVSRHVDMESGFCFSAWKPAVAISGPNILHMWLTESVGVLNLVAEEVLTLNDFAHLYSFLGIMFWISAPP